MDAIIVAASLIFWTAEFVSITLPATSSAAVFVTLFAFNKDSNVSMVVSEIVLIWSDAASTLITRSFVAEIVSPTDTICVLIFCAWLARSMAPLDISFTAIFTFSAALLHKLIASFTRSVSRNRFLAELSTFEILADIFSFRFIAAPISWFVSFRIEWIFISAVKSPFAKSASISTILRNGLQIALAENKAIIIQKITEEAYTIIEFCVILLIPLKTSDSSAVITAIYSSLIPTQ